MAELIKSTFSDWTLAKLDTTFQLKRIYNHVALKEWLQIAEKIKISDAPKEALIVCKEYAQLGIDSWNEEEIKQDVIYPIFALIRFTIFEKGTRSVLAKSFAEREFGGITAKHQIKGRPDGLIAKGAFEPKQPFFCFHEYKRQHDSKSGLGQLLAAMLIAQKTNTKQRPIYGAYVIGAYWYFVVLDKKEYSISSSFDVTKDDIFDIYRILQQLKLYVIQFLEEDKDLP